MVRRLYILLFLFLVGCVSSSTNPNKSLGSILLIHGSAPFDENGNVPDKRAGKYEHTNFYRDLAASLEARGWRVFRYSKPGVGKTSIDFEKYKTTDVASIGQQLKSIWDSMPANQSRYIFAWSEGSLHVHLLPIQQAQGIVVLGGVSTNLKSVVLAQAKSDAERQETKKQLEEALHLKRDSMLGLDRPVGRLIDEFEMPDNWSFFQGPSIPPMLILHGKADEEVPVSEALVWSSKLSSQKLKVVVVPGRNHMFGFGAAHGADKIAEEISVWGNAAHGRDQ